MGNFLESLGLLRPSTREAVPGVPSTTDPAAPENQPAVKGGSFEERIIRPYSQETALTISAVYRAVELRAKTEAQFEAQYQKFDYPGGNFITDMWGVGRKYNYLLSLQPNPTMTAASFWKQVVIQKLMKGNAVAYIERDEFGQPAAFWLCSSVSLYKMTGEYDLQYYSDYGIVTKNNVPRSEVLHFMNTYTTPDGLWGYPTLRYAIDSLSLVKTESNQALESAAKGGRVKLLIGEEKVQNGGGGLLAGGLYNKDAMKSYAKEINSEIYRQDVVSLRGLDKVQQISLSAQEMQQVEMLGMGMDDVARFYATPRPLLMLDTNSHYTTYINARMEYLSNTVQADIEEHEQELQRKLIPFREYGSKRWHLCEQPIMRLDKEAQAKVDEINLRTGAKTVNEIRQQYDLPAVKDGDKIYISTNLAELGSEKLSGANGATGATEPSGDPSGTGTDDDNQKGGES